MSKQVKYKKVAELNLASLRPPGLTQSKAADYFGLSAEHGYKSIVDWEAGVAKPDKERRNRFIGYLWDKLELRRSPQEFERIWQVLVTEWHWSPIRDEEWREHFPGLPHLGQPQPLFAQTLPTGNALGPDPQPLFLPQAPISAVQQKIGVRHRPWLVALLVILAGAMVAIYLSWQPSCMGTRSTQALTGIIEINCKGLTIIRTYDLWFTAKVAQRWQIWHVDSHSGLFQPINFTSEGKPLLLDQFVPAISPDGTRIAFAAGQCNGAGFCNRDLFLANIDGSATRRLVIDPNLTPILDEYGPSWSPDGRQLVYHAGNASMPYGLWIFSLATGQATQLTAQGDYDPVWSPSGRYLAYHTARRSAVKVLDYKSCKRQVNSCKSWNILADRTFATTAPSWLNDHELVFAANKGERWLIYKIPVTADRAFTNPEQLTINNFDNVYPAVFDGQILLWQAFPHEVQGNEGAATDRYAEIYVMNLLNGAETPLITGVGNARNGFLQRRHSWYNYPTSQ